MTTLIVVLKKHAVIEVYFDGNIGRAELVDEELEDLHGEAEISDYLSVKPLKQLPKEYRERFNIVNTDPIKHRR